MKSDTLRCKIREKNGSKENDVDRAIEETTQGYFYIGGYTESLNAMTKQAILLKIDRAGHLVWHKTIKAQFINFQITCIKETLDYSLYITGLSVDKNDFSHISLLKTDFDGIKSKMFSSDDLIFIEDSPTIRKNDVKLILEKAPFLKIKQ